MRILFASTSPGSREGGELYLLYLGRALVQRGHSVTLWTSNHSRMDELANSFLSFGEVIRSPYYATEQRRRPFPASPLRMWNGVRIAREWRKTGTDLIHINKQNLEDGLELLRAVQWSRLPSICTIHLTQSARFLGRKFAKARDWMARRALRRYRGFIVAVLENRRRDLLQFLGATPKVRLIPNGVPLFDLSQREALRASKRAELGFVGEDQVFLGVGRMIPQKRPLLFLEQAEAIRKRAAKARFLWLGDGPLAGEWDAAVAARGLTKAVQRLPWQMDIQPFFFAADLLLHVAAYEGLPLSILEALSASLPAAITPNLLAEMPFFDESNALSVDAEGTWMGVLEDAARLQQIGTAGRRLAEHEFSFTNMAEHYETLYQVAMRSEA